MLIYVKKKKRDEIDSNWKKYISLYLWQIFKNSKQLSAKMNDEFIILNSKIEGLIEKDKLFARQIQDK